MPPNSAPSSDVDNEATAELPVLDVAAYEAAHTDTWVLPSSTFTPVTPDAVEATTEMPALKLENIPTLTKAVPAPVVLPPSPPLIEDLRNALAESARRVAELQERARIADAERTVAIARANAESAQLREQLGVQVEALSTARERLGAHRKDQTDLTDAFNARGDRIAELERQLAEHAGTLEQVRAQLAASGERGETLDCDVKNLRATVKHREDRIAILEADLLARQQREQSLSAKLAEAMAAIRPEVPQLQAEILAREEKLHALGAELKQARAQSLEMEDDLRVAEESILQLENELRDKSGKLQEANVTVEEWRAVIAESQRSILQRDSRIQQLESDLVQHRFSSTLDTAAQTGEEPAIEGPARVLIRADGNTDFVHVLGRRTRIGRGSDNEIVLDTKHVSRYHAVLLAGPVHTSIEDLNSTNGVFVNGKRVTRQVLSHGDKVVVGKSQFRYAVRE